MTVPSDIDAFLREHRDRLLRYALRLLPTGLRHHAEDKVQEACWLFARRIASWPAGRPLEDPRAYLFQILRREIARFCKRPRTAAVPEGELESRPDLRAGGIPEDCAAREARWNGFGRTMAAITPVNAEAAALEAACGGDDRKELCVLLGLPVREQDARAQRLRGWLAQRPRHEVHGFVDGGNQVAIGLGLALAVRLQGTLVLWAVRLIRWRGPVVKAVCWPRLLDEPLMQRMALLYPEDVFLGLSGVLAGQLACGATAYAVPLADALCQLLDRLDREGIPAAVTEAKHLDAARRVFAEARAEVEANRSAYEEQTQAGRFEIVDLRAVLEAAECLGALLRSRGDSHSFVPADSEARDVLEAFFVHLSWWHGASTMSHGGPVIASLTSWLSRAGWRDEEDEEPPVPEV